MTTQELLPALHRRASDLGQRPNPPASADQLAAAEERLKFPLPRQLRLVYSQVGNGGFGPGRGLLPIHGPAPLDLGRNAVDAYLNNSQPMPGYPDLIWPAGMLPFCWWGDGIFSYVDCSAVDAGVYRFVSPADWSWDVQGYHFYPVTLSLSQWLQQWADSGEVDH